MARIPFDEIRFFNPDETSTALEKRLTTHLRNMREATGNGPCRGARPFSFRHCDDT